MPRAASLVVEIPDFNIVALSSVLLPLITGTRTRTNILIYLITLTTGILPLVWCCAPGPQIQVLPKHERSQKEGREKEKKKEKKRERERERERERIFGVPI